MVTQVKHHLAQLRPDLVVVSGDLTQRARPVEFAEARAFLDSIEAPQIVIPGNHDIALYNLYGRFIERLQRYKTHISSDLEPFYSDSEVIVVSVNTARSLTFKGGRINAEQVSRLRHRLGTAARGAMKILVAHHPLDLPEAFSQALVGRARMAMKALTDSGIDVILSGHLHVSRFSGPAERLRIGGHSALLVQSGTAVSTRSRGELNSFNVIEATSNRVTIQQRCWSAMTSDFTRCTTEHYHRSAAGWVRASE